MRSVRQGSHLAIERSLISGIQPAQRHRRSVTRLEIDHRLFVSLGTAPEGRHADRTTFVRSTLT